MPSWSRLNKYGFLQCGQQIDNEMICNKWLNGHHLGISSLSLSYVSKVKGAGWGWEHYHSPWRERSSTPHPHHQSFCKQMLDRTPLLPPRYSEGTTAAIGGLKRGSEPPVNEQEFSRQCKINGALSASAGVSMNCGPAACLWQMECTEYQRAVIQKKTDFDKF